jgi:hypothetical protein
MTRRVSWWLCLGVLGGLLGVLPSARAQSGDPADLEAPEWEEGEDHPALDARAGAARGRVGPERATARVPRARG